MSNLSLRQYLERYPLPYQGLRTYCAPDMKTISLRSLMSSLRVIHISDLHIFEDDSKDKCAALERFLLNPFYRKFLATNIIVITGDLTAGALSLGQAQLDFENAKNFIQRLTQPTQPLTGGYVVYVTPGNHDYLISGGLAVTPPSERLMRQNLFREYISGGNNEYPLVAELSNGRLILLDSIEDQLHTIAGKTFELELGRGSLGKPQLQKLEEYLARPEVQAQRKMGMKIVVALHHSPFVSVKKIQADSEPLLENEPDSPPWNRLGLHDARDFLSIIDNKIDCLLYGHVTPLADHGQDHRPWLNPGPWLKPEEKRLVENEEKIFADAEQYYGIPLINCENLEKTSMSYSVSVLDLGTYQRVVYQTDTSFPMQAIKPIEYSWGVPPEWA